MRPNQDHVPLSSTRFPVNAAAALAGPPVPQFSAIPTWCALTGMSRTATYREIAAGNLQAKKLGFRTLIDVQAGLAWLRALPAADIRA